MIQKKKILIGTDFGATFLTPLKSHHWGECMEDWHDYKWRKGQEEMDRRRIR